MEKYIKNVNTPCVVNISVHSKGASISTTLKKEGYLDEYYSDGVHTVDVDEKNNLNITCDDEKTIKVIINYVPDDIQNKITPRDFSDDRYYYGGTDNWGDFSDYEEYNQVNYNKILKFLDDETVIEWKDDMETNIVVKEFNKENKESFTSLEGKVYKYVTKKYQEPLVIDYYKDSITTDDVYIDDIIIDTGENSDWCKCVRLPNGSLKYTAKTSNPRGKPRFAYFKHRVKYGGFGESNNAGVMNKGPRAGSYVLPEWIVTVIQLPNPNIDDNIIKLEDLGDKLYSVGLLSDIHFDVNDYMSQYVSDLSNALKYFLDNKVDFISCAGDICEYHNYDINKFNEFYNKYSYDFTKNSCLRLFTCLGNNDYMKFYSDGETNELYNSIMHFSKYFSESNLEESYDINYFEYDGEWNKQYVGTRTNKSKTNYYVTYKDDIYIYLSVDYGDDSKITDYQLIRAYNKIDYNDKYVKQIMPFAIEAGYNEEVDGKFDYQFYNSNSLIWLKDIIENNLDKHIFLFMHHGLPHKAGNGTWYEGTYYSQNKIYPHDNRRPIYKDISHSGSYVLCGLQFYFLNWLNNKYKHVIWFSGHTHYSWECGESKYINQFIGDQYFNYCNKDFNVYKPTGTEYYKNPTKPDLLSEDYDPKIYSRIPLIIGLKSTNDVKEIYEDNPICESAWNIHLPSLSKPRSKINEIYKGSEGGIMEVYQYGIRIIETLFKDENTNEYINYTINEKLIKFD